MIKKAYNKLIEKIGERIPSGRQPLGNVGWMPKNIPAGIKLIKNKKKFLDKIFKHTVYRINHFGKIPDERGLLKIELKDSGMKFIVPETLGALTDLGIINEIFRKKKERLDGDYFWNKKKKKLYEIGEDDIVVDIGGHRGYFSCFAAKLAKSGKVYSFEPSNYDCELLRKNEMLNKIGDNLEIYNAGILKSPNIKTLNIDNVGSGGNTLIGSKRKTQLAEFYSLAQLIESKKGSKIESDKIKKIDFLKIDTEGSEFDILESPDWVFKGKKEIGYLGVKHISMEVHEWMVSGKDKVSYLINKLSSLGYDVTFDANISILYADKK
ncbi:MAG: FkbM family methyltransferase [archaeon]